MGEDKSGVDCTKLLGSILVELGVFSATIEGFHIPPDWFINGKDELLLETVDKHIELFLDEEKHFILKHREQQKLEFGDFLFFSLSKSGVSHHAAVYVGGDEIFHVWHKGYCSFAPLSRAWKNRISWNYRLMEV